MTPSNSTNGTAVAGALAAILMAILGKYNITFPAGIESAIAVVFATLGGYLPASGRK
jgi:hypothetical protein